MNFGKLVKENREAQGLSIYKLSQMCDVSKSALRAWEQKGIEPTAKKLDKVLKALGIAITLGKENKTK